MFNVFKTRQIVAAVALTALVGSIAVSAFAEDENRFINRENRQENRINNDEGHLGGQYNHLQRQENRISREDQRDLQRNGGHLNPYERRRLGYQQNHLNHEIRRDRFGHPY